jgi:hypothetical protein
MDVLAIRFLRKLESMTPNSIYIAGPSNNSVPSIAPTLKFDRTPMQLLNGNSFHVKSSTLLTRQTRVSKDAFQAVHDYCG